MLSPTDRAPDAPPEFEPITFRGMLLIWLTIGLQSFGGGMVTFALIQRTAIDRFRWLTAEEFARDWALVQVAPGINLVALTILIGKRAGGYPGAVAATAGLLIPSVTITIAISAVYDHLHRIGLVNRALAGAIPAVLGVGFAAGLALVKPVLDQSRDDGAVSRIIGVALFAGSGVAAAFHVNVVGVLLGAGAVGAAFAWIQARSTRVSDGGAA